MTKHAIHELEQLCAENPDSCATVVNSAKAAIQLACDSPAVNSTTAKACEVAEEIFGDVVAVWSRIQGYCHTGVCELVGQVQKVCNHSGTDYRDAACNWLQTEVQGVTAKVCNLTISLPTGSDVEVCEVLETVVLDPTHYQQAAEDYCNCADTSNRVKCASQKALCTTAQTVISAACAASNTSQKVCEVAEELVADWPAIDATLLEFVGDVEALCSGDGLCGSGEGDRSLLSMVTEFCNSSAARSEACAEGLESLQGLVSDFCLTNELECKVIAQVSDAVNWSEPSPVRHWVQQEVQEAEDLFTDAREWCHASEWQGEVCGVVRDLVVEDFKIIWDALSVHLNLSHVVQEAADVARCALEPSDWTIPSEGLYVPLSWADEWTDLSDDDVEAYKSSVTDNQDLAKTMRLWFLIIGTGFFLSAALLLLSRWATRRASRLKHASLDALDNKPARRNPALRGWV
mmetsp:Transcript_4069/g.11927  ORF Transcript_4069/g.11927 Transcript_4069/m.11927 type:complete len:460 (-) Transcript_4069:597-1976(-)